MTSPCGGQSRSHGKNRSDGIVSAPVRSQNRWSAASVMCGQNLAEKKIKKGAGEGKNVARWLVGWSLVSSWRGCTPAPPPRCCQLAARCAGCTGRPWMGVGETVPLKSKRRQR